MAQPFNYTIQAPSAFESLVSGLRLGTSLEEMRLQQEQRAAQVAQAQQKAMQEQQRQMRMQEIYGKVNAGNASQADWIELGDLSGSEASRKGVWETIGRMDENTVNARIGTTQQFAVAFSKNPELAKSMLDDYLQANPNDAEMKRIRQMANSDPKLAGEALLSALPGMGQRGLEAYKTAIGRLFPTEKESAESTISAARAKYADVLAANEVAKGAAEAKKLGIDGDKLLQDIAESKRKLAMGPEIDADARKIVNDSVTSSMASRSLASQYESLANNISVELASGVRARGEEAVRRFFGSEGQVTRLRQEYRRLRNSQVLQNLPPGAASDIDIQIAMDAFPAETADPDVLVRFLRGTAKLQRYDSALAAAKAEWTAQNGSLGRSRRDLTVMGQTIPAGSNFDQTIGSLLPNVDVLDVEGVAQPGGQAPAAVTAPARPAATTQPIRPSAPTQRSVDDLLNQYRSR
jgi:hypothetical protein